MDLRTDAAGLSEELVDLRRDLHRHPEVGLHLPRTQERVLRALAHLTADISTGSGLSSVTAVVSGARRGEGVVLLRADMDGLPVEEQVKLSYSSSQPARMHACGHDLHTAILVGAAHLVAKHRDRFGGKVVLMFQPGEEGFDGAGRMVDEGVLDVAGARPHAALALHVLSSVLPNGQFSSRAGAVLASAAALRITVLGIGGHGSAPHRALDPVPVACEIVLALYAMVTRRFDVFDPVVLSVGVLRACVRENVIPDRACVEATVRAFSEETRAYAVHCAREICTGIASAHGLKVEIAIESGYPSTINDPGVVASARSTVIEMCGEAKWQELPRPFSGSEDFSRILQSVPGAMLFLGACPPEADPAKAPFNHSSTAEFDDAVVADGAAVMAGFALRKLMAGDSGRPAEGSS